MKVGKVLVVILGISFFILVIVENQEMTSVWSIDFSGKPPFKRKMVKARTADLARTKKQSTLVISGTDFRGKPPYTRNKETVRVVDHVQSDTINKKKFVPTPRRMK